MPKFWTHFRSLFLFLGNPNAGETYSIYQTNWLNYRSNQFIGMSADKSFFVQTDLEIELWIGFSSNFVEYHAYR
jgi:hypothetical protein